MLSWIKLKNFRSYNDVELKFDPGVNVIIGDNDNGKTNILRGIDLIANNRPVGTSYISHWGGPTEVHLCVDNKVISRIRSDKENLYLIDKKKLKAFGMGVPEEVKNLLNMSSINLNYQFEGPFLIGQSPAEVGRYFNDLVNLSIIDSSISNIDKMLTKEQTKYQKIKTDEATLIEEIKALEWLNEAEEKLIKIENLQELINQKKQDAINLQELIISYKELYKQKTKVQTILTHKKTITKLHNDLIKVRSLKEEREKLKHITDKLNDLINRKNKIKKITKFKEQINILIKEDQELIKADKEFNEFECLVINLKELVNKKDKLEKITKFSEHINDLISKNQTLIKTYEVFSEFKDLVSNLENLKEKKLSVAKKLIRLKKEWNQLMPDECPLCGRSCDCNINI